jgi:hypothetical protein
MINAYILKHSKIKSLSTQIRDAEQGVMNRQQRVSIHNATLIRTIHQKLTAPTTLLMAGGIGFLIGELTQRPTHNSDSTVNKPRPADTSPLRTALNLITSVYTLYKALPLAWIIKSHHQLGTSGLTPKRQFHPTAGSGNRRRSNR